MRGNSRTWGSLQSMLYHKMEPQALGNWFTWDITTIGSDAIYLITKKKTGLVRITGLIDIWFATLGSYISEYFTDKSTHSSGWMSWVSKLSMCSSSEMMRGFCNKRGKPQQFIHVILFDITVCVFWPTSLVLLLLFISFSCCGNQRERKINNKCSVRHYIIFIISSNMFVFHILPNDEIQLLDTHWIPLSS